MLRIGTPYKYTLNITIVSVYDTGVSDSDTLKTSFKRLLYFIYIPRSLCLCCKMLLLRSNFKPYNHIPDNMCSTVPIPHTVVQGTLPSSLLLTVPQLAVQFNTPISVYLNSKDPDLRSVEWSVLHTCSAW